MVVVAATAFSGDVVPSLSCVDDGFARVVVVEVITASVLVVIADAVNLLVFLLLFLLLLLLLF